MTGNASRIITWVMSAIHVKIGMRMSFMPGARMFRIVTKKFTPPASVDTPRIWRPMFQKSTFSPGENCRLVRLA